MTDVLSQRSLNRATLPASTCWNARRPGRSTRSGTWQIRDQALRIQPFTKLHRADRDALLAEAAQLCAFVAPQTTYDMVLGKP